MRKILLLTLVSLVSCTERGCTDTQILNNNKRPYRVIAKAPPYASDGSGKTCYLRLQGSDGNTFVINDCDMCRSYEVGDTVR